MEKSTRKIYMLMYAFWISAAPRPAALKAQVPLSPSAYRFEVAAIKPSAPGSEGTWLIPEAHGGFRAQNVVVWQLIKNAYYLRDQQLKGGPEWVKTDRFDIVAKAEETEASPLIGTASNPVKVASHMARHRQRLQTLLRDRFGLVLGTETSVQSFYSLKIMKPGHKMEVAGTRDGDPIARLGTGRLMMTADMKGIAAMLTDIVGRPVVDETHLPGYFNVRLEWAPDTTDIEAGAGSIFTAVSEQLGLQLEARKGPMPVFVISKIQRPSEN